MKDIASSKCTSTVPTPCLVCDIGVKSEMNASWLPYTLRHGPFDGGGGGGLGFFFENNFLALILAKNNLAQWHCEKISVSNSYPKLTYRHV